MMLFFRVHFLRCPFSLSASNANQTSSRKRIKNAFCKLRVGEAVTRPLTGTPVATRTDKSPSSAPSSYTLPKGSPEHINFSNRGSASTLFVMGGWNGASNLKSVEWYDAHTDQWSSGPSMHDRRRGLSACSHQKYAAANPCCCCSCHSLLLWPEEWCGAISAIYAVGGWNGEHYLKTMESFDPRVGKWSAEGTMPRERCRSLKLKFANGFASGRHRTTSTLNDDLLRFCAQMLWRMYCPRRKNLHRRRVLLGRIAFVA